MSSPATSSWSSVWGYDYAGETRTVDVHVHWLRAQIEADPANPIFLETVRGVGYVLRPPRSRLSALARRAADVRPLCRTNLRRRRCAGPPPIGPDRSCSTRYEAAAMSAEQGIVRIQAVTMLRATPQRTALRRSLVPTPMIALEMTWVVETGIPKCDAPRMIVAAVVSAAKPWTGSSFTTRWPIVFMIRQPPAAVPRDMAVAAMRITHTGTPLSWIASGVEEGQGHDAHRLLGVVGAVAQSHVGGRQDLERGGIDR